MSNILEVFDRRIRGNPATLVIYEHEVDKFVEALRDLTWDTLLGRKTNDRYLEESIRNGTARYRGLPVRLDQQSTEGK